MKKEIIIYQSKNGALEFKGDFKKETIWASLQQIADLFGRDKSVISRHIKNIFKEKELSRNSVVAFFATTASDGKTYQVEHFDLDLVLSVGYRVNSKTATAFRQWATKTLHQHIVKGYSVDEKRLKALNQTLRIAADISKRKLLSGDEASALLQTVSDYSAALGMLDDYDHQRVKVGKTSRRKAKPITYDEVIQLIEEMRIKFGASDLFGKEKDKSLNSSLNAVMQSFDGKDVYPSVEEKGANLLYFLVKNHSFVDGNKRIAAAVFLRFGEKNQLIYNKEGQKRIADNALVAMTLMIAESNPKEKEVITAMMTNLIAGD